MSTKLLDQLTSFGRKVDPVIIKALSRSSNSTFLPALEYHFKAGGGKRMRAALVMLSCAAAGGKMSDALAPAAVVELIHNYSLVMDDIIDHGDVRRGKPTVRAKMGDSVALLVGMFYREIIDDLVEKCPTRDKIRRKSVEAMKEIIDGERLDLLFEQAGRADPYLISNRVLDPDFRMYLDMIGKKTASLYRTAAIIGGYAAKADKKTIENLGEFGWKAGLAFQVMDDVLDVYGQSTGKEAAKDVIEHKLGNAAILVALRHLSKSRKSELLSILRSERVTKSMASKARALAVLTPAEYECRTVAMEYLDEAKKHLEVLEDSDYKRSLSQLADMVVLRTY